LASPTSKLGPLQTLDLIEGSVALRHDGAAPDRRGRAGSPPECIVARDGTRPHAPDAAVAPRRPSRAARATAGEAGRSILAKRNSARPWARLSSSLRRTDCQRSAAGHKDRERLVAWDPRGIAFRHSRPYHPQTCGKVERFHQTLKKWLAQQTARSSPVAWCSAVGA
jgi:hypothetical protein